MSNHIGDTNKMVSDTPRTNKEAFLPHDSKYRVCDADFARQLERELNAANVEIEEKRKDVVWLATEKAKLEKHIKRLEDSYAAKDQQLSNLLHICRDNDIEVSSYDLIHGKEAKL